MITSINGDHHLRSYENKETYIEISKEIDLGCGFTNVYPYRDIQILDDLLYISLYDHLVVVDVNRDPIIVLSQIYPEPIVDVCPLG